MLKVNHAEATMSHSLEYSKLESTLWQVAADLVYINRDMPFATTPTEQTAKLRLILDAAQKLLNAIDSLVPKGHGSLEAYPFHSELAVSIDQAYSVLMMNAKKPTLKGTKVDFGDDFRMRPVGLMKEGLERFCDATSLAIDWVKPSPGRAAGSSIGGKLKKCITANLVHQYVSTRYSYPPITKDGWATVFLESIFEKYSLGDGANHYLRAEIKTRISGGLTREILKKECSLHVSK